MEDFEKMAEEMYSGSAFTIEGAGGDIEEWKKWIQSVFNANEIGTVTKWYTYDGKQMNERYHLTGNNRYPDDLHFLSCSLDGLAIGKLAYLKFKLEARWFDDIVDNNERREGMI